MPWWGWVLIVIAYGILVWCTALAVGGGITIADNKENPERERPHRHAKEK